MEGEMGEAAVWGVVVQGEVVQGEVVMGEPAPPVHRDTGAHRRVPPKELIHGIVYVRGFVIPPSCVPFQLRSAARGLAPGAPRVLVPGVPQ